MKQPFDKYELDEYFRQINNHNDIKKLINSIEFNDGFLLNIIFTDSINDAKVVTSYLSEMLAEEVIVLPETFPETYEQYIEYVLEPLKSVKSDKIKNAVLLFDLTFLDKDNLYDTERFLIKLNEFRNNLINIINRPVILVLQHSVKELFVSFAKDTWSLRTVVVDLVLENVKEEEIADTRLFSQKNYFVRIKTYIMDKIFSFFKNQNLGNHFKKDKKINLLYKEHKRLSAKEKQDDSSKRLLMINSAEIGNYHLQTGSLDDALFYYDKALALAESISKIRPDSIEAKRDLSVSLDNVAKIYLQKGEAQKALEYYRRSLTLRESISKIRPDSIEAKRDLSVSLNNIAQIYLQKGEAQKAQTLLQKAKALVGSVVDFYPYGDFKDILQHIEDKLNKLGKDDK